MNRAATDDAQPLTRTVWAYQRLRQAILNGEYGPGDSLVISTLADTMGVSATPLREAVRDLASDGFVELQTHGKARVAEVDQQEATEIYELRLMLEPAALERSVRNADDAYAERVEAAWRALDHQRVASPSAHANFHRELLSACDSAWMHRLAQQLADRAGLMISVGLNARPNSYNTSEAHRTLKDLAVSGQSTAAADELRRHLAGSIAFLQRIVQGPNETTDLTSDT